MKRPSVIVPSEITPHGTYERRREFVKLAGAGALLGAAGLLGRRARAQDKRLGLEKLEKVEKSSFSTAEPPTAYKHVTGYNNYYEFGTGKEDPSEKMGPKYDTPTLLGVYRTAPYLHHGKAKTLHEVLTPCNKGDRHGKTSHLKPAEIDDLVAFLRSLPYEPPPALTPNTVPYRLVVPGKKE